MCVFANQQGPLTPTAQCHSFPGLPRSHLLQMKQTDLVSLLLFKSTVSFRGLSKVLMCPQATHQRHWVGVGFSMMSVIYQASPALGEPGAWQQVECIPPPSRNCFHEFRKKIGWNLRSNPLSCININGPFKYNHN